MRRLSEVLVRVLSGQVIRLKVRGNAINLITRANRNARAAGVYMILFLGGGGLWYLLSDEGGVRIKGLSQEATEWILTAMAWLMIAWCVLGIAMVILSSVALVTRISPDTFAMRIVTPWGKYRLFREQITHVKSWVTLGSVENDVEFVLKMHVNRVELLLGHRADAAEAVELLEAVVAAIPSTDVSDQCDMTPAP